MTLERDEVHTVDICPTVPLYMDSHRREQQVGPLKQSIYKCDGLICRKCRCDTANGYKLSNDTEQAVCVKTCPKSRYIF